MNWNESATDTVSGISLGVGSTNHSLSMITMFFFSGYKCNICCEQKQSSNFHKFSGPKQQLISTESTEKTSEGAQNLIAIVLSLSHRDEENICGY